MVVPQYRYGPAPDGEPDHEQDEVALVVQSNLFCGQEESSWAPTQALIPAISALPTSGQEEKRHSQGQWWSIISTQRLQTLQWCVRCAQPSIPGKSLSNSSPRASDHRTSCTVAPASPPPPYPALRRPCPSFHSGPADRSVPCPAGADPTVPASRCSSRSDPTTAVPARPAWAPPSVARPGQRDIQAGRA